MGKRKKRTTTCKRKEDSKVLRADRRAEVQHERTTRTCSCPPWAKHRDDCPVGYLTKDDEEDDDDAAIAGNTGSTGASNTNNGDGGTDGGTDDTTS